MTANGTFAGATQAPPGSLRALASWHAGPDSPREENARLTNVTPHGATLLLEDAPELGQLLCLQMPGPRGRSSEGARMWGLVWAVAKSGGRNSPDSGAACQTVGVLFVGDDAPAPGRSAEASSYAYLIEEDGKLRLQRRHAAAAPQSHERRESRLCVPVEILLEALRPDGTVLMREQSVTENISRSGAAVWTSLLIGAGQVVRVTSERHGVSMEAVVRGRRVGQDGIARLHLEFVGGQWPLEKIA